MLVKLILCLVVINNCVQGMHIAWDKDELAYLYDLKEYVRSEDVPLPNWRFTFPGTKWCGKGNVASSFDDLGEFKLTDKCCRNHDACDDYIEGYQTAYNLTNDSIFTRLSCECDKEFYKCLKTIDTFDSISVGAIYFNFLGTQCFKKDYATIGCKEYVYVPRKKCILYDVNRNSRKIYQWFDVPIF